LYIIAVNEDYEFLGFYYFYWLIGCDFIGQPILFGGDSQAGEFHFIRKGYTPA